MQNLEFQTSKTEGAITFGTGNILCTKVTIKNTLTGSITIGNDNIFHEMVTIINNTPNEMVIGNNNQFNSKCLIENSNIGDFNEIGINSKCKDSSIGSNCNIVMNSYLDHDVLRDRSSFLNGKNTTVETSGTSIHSKHLEYLRETLPKYHEFK
jgi:dynactin-6